MRMTVKLDPRLPLRVLLYFIGLLCVAFGVAFSVKSNLGTSPISSLPFAAHNVLLHHGINAVSYGTCVTLSHLIFMLVQAIILRRAYKAVYLLQVIVSTVFGWFVDFAVAVVGPAFDMPYAAQLGWLALAVAVISVGVSLYVGMDIMPMPGDGISVAFSRKLATRPYHQMKRIVDSVMVALAVLVSLVGIGYVVGVREGTVLAAILVGPVTGRINSWIAPVLKKVRPDTAAQP